MCSRALQARLGSNSLQSVRCHGDSPVDKIEAHFLLSQQRGALSLLPAEAADRRAEPRDQSRAPPSGPTLEEARFSLNDAEQTIEVKVIY
jgi:hypothetical protein